MVCSLGLSFVLENIARLMYGNNAKSFAIELARPFFFMDIRMNREQIITIIVSTIAMIFMYILLKHMPIGRAMRAVSDNQSLSLVRGIDTPMIIKWTWFISGILLTTGGVLIGMDRAIVIPPNYRTGIPLAVIALILIFRPQGIFGKPNIKK